MSDPRHTVIPQSELEIVDLVKSGSSLIPRGGGSKPTLWTTRSATTVVDMRKLSGIVEYLPSEYTITVKSGTPLQELIAALKENGQYLPFDPPFECQGASIGGTVAAGLSGPGAYRYGPLKDFIIGVRFIDGAGNQVRGGGKVVKNAAGFDFPKLFNGSLGRLGILTELSFKVFPEPKSYVTLSTRLASTDEALKIFPKLLGFDLEGVELDHELRLFLRLGYQESTMEARKQGLESLVGQTFKLTSDLGETVGGNSAHSIGGDRGLTVAGNQGSDVGGNSGAAIGGNRMADVGGSESLTVGMNQDTKVGVNYGLDAGMAIHLKAGMTFVIEAGVKLSLKVGGSFVDISPVGVAISGPLVMINSGGAAGSGAGASPQSPDSPAAPESPEEAAEAEPVPPDQAHNSKTGFKSAPG